MPTEYAGQFDVLCTKCGKPAAEWVRYYTDASCRLCEPCYEARQATPKLATDPDGRDEIKLRYQDERSTDGRSILKDNQGFYRQTESERHDV